MCQNCNNTGQVKEIICGMCEENIPHSHCDDTSEKRIICPICKGKTNFPSFGGLDSVPKNRQYFIPIGR